MGTTCRTREEVAAWFYDEGIPVSTWAIEHGFAPTVVYALLSGRTCGRRGESHRAAIALGLKNRISDEPDIANKQAGFDF